MRRCEDWLKSYIQYTSDLEAPDQFHFWAGVHAIGGALAGKTWFNMGKFKWRPSFYIVYLAPPGIATKSTTVGAVEDLMEGIASIKNGPTSVTMQALFDAFIEVQETTVAKNAHTDMQNVTHASCVIQVSELGNFLDLYDNKLIDFLVDAWDSREKPTKRRTRGGGEIEFRTPCLNLIGATTPSWLRGNMPEYMITGGLTSRMIFVKGEHKRQFVPYPFLQQTGIPVHLREDLAHDLQEIANLSGQFKMTPEALEKGSEWYNSYWESIPKHLRDERMQGYASRKQCHLHKLAMVLSAARSDSMIITLREFDEALTILGALEADLADVFNSVTENEGVKQLAIVLAALRQNGRITKPKLFRICCTRMDYRSFENAVNGMMSAGYARQIVTGSATELEYVAQKKEDA